MDKTKALENLHQALTQVLMEKVSSGEATAGDLNVARQFLKDNGIDVASHQAKPLVNLAKLMPFDPDSQDSQAA